MDAALLVAGAALLGLLWSRTSSGAGYTPAGVTLPSTTRRRLTTLEVQSLAEHVVFAGGYAGDVDPAMLVAMAWIESAFDPLAIGTDGKSHGLMQIRPSTAEDITARLGGAGYSGPEDLYNPALSLDFAARYVKWLRTWNGTRRADSWVVQAYNGGAGTAANGGNSMTRKHWCKYQHTLAALQSGRNLPNVASLPC